MLSPDLIVAAYMRGYFPMADASGEVGWYLPERRAVFLPGDAHISHSLRRSLSRGEFEVVFDRDFGRVISACAVHDETWISEEIIRAYAALHQHGFAHSVESYSGGELVGGLYGVAIGGAFFGESMFHRVTNASKAAFAALCMRLEERGYILHDAQFMTPHLARLGAREIPKAQYLRLLGGALRLHCRLA